MSNKPNKFGEKAGVKLASSLLALSGVLATQYSFAQEKTQTDSGVKIEDVTEETPTIKEDAGIAVEEVIVTGTHQSLMNAQDIKRDADTFVDAISASDIGSLPDRSVLESLQRLPGVSIERFAAKNDPDHFSAEGSNAIIRGMTATRTEFNGRDSFTANSGRGLSFQDVPPELMSSVRLYKNQSADMIEGGIGGTVSLHTRLPFDQSGQVVGFSFDETYFDLSDEYSPSISGLYSNTWDVEGIGEIGFLVGIARSQTESRSDGIQSEIFQRRVFDGQNVLLPNGSNVTMKEDDRKRNGTSAAFQWENTDETLVATATYLKSDSSLAWNENKISYQGTVTSDGVNADFETTSMAGTTFNFGGDGVFNSGVLASGAGWRSGGDFDPDRVPAGRVGAEDEDGNTIISAYDQLPVSACTDSNTDNDPDDCDVRADTFGHRFQTTSRVKRQRTIVEDYAFNLKYTPNDNWEIVADYQYVAATTRDDDMELFLGTHAMQHFDITGDVPQLVMVNPWTQVPSDTLNNPAMDDGSTKLEESYFNDPSSYWWKAAMDHYERAVGEENAARVDVTYFIDDSFLTKVQVGLRHSTRDQDVRFSRYNWEQLAEIWDGGGGDPDDDGYMAGWVDLPMASELADDVELVDWSDFNRGGTLHIPGEQANRMLHPSMELTKDYANWGTRLDPVAERDNSWRPAAERDLDDDGQYDTIGYFLPSELSDIRETNNAGYIRLDFESELAGFRYSGNVGARYFEVTSKSSGYIQFPDLVPTVTDESDPAYNRDANNWIKENLPDDSAFGNLATEFSTTENSYDYLLPSFNLKIELTDDLIHRLAVSKAVALPDIGKLRNFVTIDPERVEIIIDQDGNDDPNDTISQAPIENVIIPGYKASAGNPYLLPMESMQYDASFEWYFADVGSLTGTIFYKQLSNFFVDGAFPRVIENQSTGVSKVVNVQGTINSGEGEMAGFEIAYQQTYDFLPEPWDGLGTQFNYTLIDAKNVPNPGIADDSAIIADEEEREERADEVRYGGLPLESQSKHTANFVAYWEKYDWSLRMAYNWRSRYLVTARDVIDPYRPIWSGAAGYLDASIFYNITDEIKIGFQGQNLSNTVVETEMQISNNGYTQGRSWFTNDRRYALVFRATF